MNVYSPPFPCDPSLALYNMFEHDPNSYLVLIQLVLFAILINYCKHL